MTKLADCLIWLEFPRTSMVVYSCSSGACVDGCLHTLEAHGPQLKLQLASATDTV